MGEILLILFAGAGLALIGYGPLSMKKHPAAGVGMAVTGFVVRLAALIAIALGILLLCVPLLWYLRLPR